MAKKKVGSAGWKVMNSLFFVFAFIPILQWIPCFIMNGKLPKKKWLMMGFANIMILVLLLTGAIINGIVYDRNRASFPKSPNIEDYVSSDSLDYTDSSYKDLPEYKEYEKALEEYYESDEYIAASESTEQNSHRKKNVSLTLTLIFFMSYLVYIILLFFVERYRYFRELSEHENRRGVYGALQSSGNANQVCVNNAVPANGTNASNNSVANVGVNLNETPNAHQTVNQNRGLNTNGETPQGNTASYKAADGKMNINTATEEEFELLPAISIIDVKKIVEYRNKNGQFKNLDEFFAAFGAKPHMIVKIQDLVYIGGTENNNAGSGNNANSTSAAKNARRFDI